MRDAPEEFHVILEDQAWWKELATFLDITLVGWTYKSSGQFRLEDGSYVTINRTFALIIRRKMDSHDEASPL